MKRRSTRPYYEAVSIGAQSSWILKERAHLFSALLANLLAKAVCDLRLEIRHVLQHVAENYDFRHLAKLAILILSLAAQDLALSTRLSPATTIGVRLFTALLDLHSKRIDDSGFVGAEARTLRPSVLAHEALREARLAWPLRSRLLIVAFLARAEHSWGERISTAIVSFSRLLYIVSHGSPRDDRTVGRWGRRCCLDKLRGRRRRRSSNRRRGGKGARWVSVR